jgi:hypothetical protein
MTMPRPRTLAPVLAGLLLVAGCGSTEPEPLTRVEPEVPADLCSLVPEGARTGLQTSSSSDETGSPTAACSLRSADGATPAVRAVLTWTQSNDESTSDDVFQSQCRSIDPQEYAVQQGYTVQGADEACAGKGSSTDAATVTAVRGREVLTARVQSTPAGTPDALARSTEMLVGLLSSMGPSATTSPS